MGLRDWIKKIFSKRFGVKQISAGEAENTAGVMHETYGQNIFDELKVNGVPQIDKMKVEEIDKTAREVLKESAEKFKNTILSNEEIKKLTEESAKSGKMGDSPFICTVEMDANGEFKTTVIVKENSCAKIKEDKDGNLTYQETRIDGKEMKTIINTKDSSILITGNVSQSDIDKVQKFSNRNKATITQLKDFGEKNEEYKKLLESLGVKADIDLADKDSYMFSSTGRIIRDQNRKLKKLEEMGIVLDKKNPDKDPLIVSFNTYEKTIVKEGDKEVEKVVEKGRKFYLTKDGKYVEEGSIKFNDKGEPEFEEYTMKDLEDLATSKTLDKNFINKMKKINRDNVDLIPQAAEKLHKDLVKEELERRTQANPEQEPQKPDGEPKNTEQNGQPQTPPQANGEFGQNSPEQSKEPQTPEPGKKQEGPKDGKRKDNDEGR